MNRKRSREVAMELIFQMIVSKEESNETLQSFVENTEEDMTKIDIEYINSIVNGVHDKKEILDQNIEKYLVNWKLNRISKVNLAILRLSAYEILYLEDIPNNVAINEAIELTRKYSEESSVSFINGVLDKVSNNKQ